VKTINRQDKALLLATARIVATELQQRSQGTALRVRYPTQVGVVNTGGGRVVIGRLGKEQLQMQIWLDQFSGYTERKLYFCFASPGLASLQRIANRVARHLRPHRLITEKQIKRDGFQFLTERLSRAEFNVPILEQYYGRYSYYGMYDTTVRSTDNRVNPHFCARAAAFFEDIADYCQPEEPPDNARREVYPQFENRLKVTSHLQRERSRLLATERKIRDDYQCQICRMRFEEAYGALGQGFAEAHHVVPLSKLNGAVRTQIEDLMTVCANCHRMLHKMDGTKGDVNALRRIWKRHKK